MQSFFDVIAQCLPKKEGCATVTDVMCWVACSERLPDSIGSYLCFWENCYVGMLFFNSNKEWCEMWQQEKHKPTHWMPLPKPPCT